jgi:CO/xanthine dehydrogenase FAD-binding subunit
MYASPFQYMRAGSWQEAVALVVEGGEDARVIAGGQSLAPMMMLKMSEPSLLVDIREAAPRAIERANGTLRLSALVRHVDLETSPDVAAAFPALSEAAGMIGNVRVRHRGTIGGSLAHSDPNAELPCVALAAGATVTALGPGGQRSVPAAELFVSQFTTSLEHGELITRVDVPALQRGQGSAFVEMTRRPGDFASVMVCAIVELGSDGRCADARVAVGSTADRPLDLTAAAESLRGAVPHVENVTAAARAVADATEIGPSTHGSEAYRREMVAVLTRRALLMATARARGEGEAE